MLGWLVSATLHLAVFTLLGLLLSPLDMGKPKQLHLEMAVAASDEDAMELITIDPLHSDFEPVPDQTADIAPLQLPEVSLTATAASGKAGLGLTANPFGQQQGRASGSGAPGMFFGTQAYGDRFVYVLDMSGSMSGRPDRYHQTRFEAAAAELVRSINDLSVDQSFYVILFSYDTRQFLDSAAIRPSMVPATNDNKRHLEYWIKSIRPNGGTDPRVALRTGLQLMPSAVFLLSDGKFNGRKNKRNQELLPGNPTVEQVVAEHNLDQIPIHTFAFENQANQDRMHSLAQMSGGRYRFVNRGIGVDELKTLMELKNDADVLDALRRVIKRADQITPKQTQRMAPVLARLLSNENVEVCRLARLAILAIRKKQ